MNTIEIYTKPGCPYCANAKQLLTQQGKVYVEYDVLRQPQKLKEMYSRGLQRTVPQIFIDGVAIGGFTDLIKLHLAEDTTLHQS